MILEEKRKVIGVGKNKASLHVVLPAFWCRFKDLTAGETIKLIVTDKAVIIMKDDENADSFMKAMGIKDKTEVSTDE